MTQQALAGKIAVVAGGSLGIGRGASLRLAQAGAQVVIGARRSEPIEAVVAEIAAAGGEAMGLSVDLAQADEAKSLIEAAVERFGGVDILVNSQGIQTYGTVEETSEELWNQTIAVNLTSMFFTAKYAIPEMRKRGGGSIVNVSSVQGLSTQTQVAAYSTSKSGIIGLTRTIAVDYAKENIRANSVLPASVDTPMLRHSADLFRGDDTLEQTLDAWGLQHPIGRIGRPEEIGDLITFLAGPRATFITGAEFKIDGGMMAALGVTLPE
jgi:NAD(P)-dependent dehydrogenase (short-subunit alcohol dehydrogenase family)